MLACPPPNNATHAAHYIPEDQQFFRAPIPFLEKRYAPTGPMALPTHFILFEDPIGPAVAPFLRQHCYQEEARLFNTIASSDDRTKGDVVVWRKGTCQAPG